ncbi:MAG: Secretion system C-terminal sorting domain, partial [Bacteroidota bacterium]
DSLSWAEDNPIILVKYDSLGNMLWNRKFSYVDSYQDYHDIYDLKSTSDGGFIAVGEASDNDEESPNFVFPNAQAWILKVDGCGCLVPGCDSDCVVPNCATEIVDFPPFDSYFIYGPNPVSQSLNLYFDGGGINLEGLSFRLYDLTGRLIDQFTPYQSQTTYIWDMEHLASGEYLICLCQDDRVLQQTKVVKLD